MSRLCTSWGECSKLSSVVRGTAPAQFDFYALFGLEVVTDTDNSHFSMLKNFQIVL